MGWKRNGIPEEEHENLLSVYWQMLTELEAHCDPVKDPGRALIVEGGFRILNRAGIHDGKPRWKKS